MLIQNRELKSRLSLNSYVRRVLSHEVSEGNFEGGLTNKKYRALTKTSAVTASRQLKDLVQKGILKEVDRGMEAGMYVTIFYGVSRSYDYVHLTARLHIF